MTPQNTVRTLPVVGGRMDGMTAVDRGQTLHSVGWFTDLFPALETYEREPGPRGDRWVHRKTERLGQDWVTDPAPENPNP